MTAEASQYQPVDKLYPILTALLVVVVGAYAAVRFAFRRFYAEKQWERKSDAYTKIFIAIHKIKNYCEHELHILNDGANLPQAEPFESERRDIVSRLQEEMVSGAAELELYVDIGTFALSPEAIAQINDLLAGLDESIKVWRLEKSLSAHFQHTKLVADQALEKLRRIAERDLSPRWRW